MKHLYRDICIWWVVRKIKHRIHVICDSKLRLTVLNSQLRRLTTGERLR